MSTMRALLLASVSALTMAAGLSVARAEDGSFIFGVSGGGVVGNNATIESFRDSGLYEIVEIDVPDFSGPYFAMTVGTQIMPLVDLRARVSLVSASAGESDFTYFDPEDEEDKLGTLDTGLDYQMLDIEAGYTPALSDDFEVRLVAGVRAMRLTDRLMVDDKNGTDFYDNEFLGAGPRVAIEASTRFGGTPFGASASAGGSVLFGRMERRIDGEVEDTIDKTIGMLDAKATLDYHVTEQAKLSLGYRAEKLYGAHDFVVDDAAIAGDQLTHGPVLEFLGRF